MSDALDEGRVAALRALDVLDSAPEERFDRIARIARGLFGVGSVGVSLIDRDRQFTKSGVGDISPGDTPRSESLCTFTVQQDELFEIPDARADPGWATHPAVTGDLAMRFYAGVPLRSPGGERVGALCLVDSSPRTLSNDERELFDALAELVERELATTAEMEQGREVQRRLLPRHSPDVPGWDVGGASRQHGAVGGDFYDWQVLDPSLQLVLCDVMGKGLSAALLAAGFRVVARGASAHHTLESTVTRVSEDLALDLEETSSFATAFLARIVPDSGRVEYVDAGHGLAFVLGTDGRHRRLRSDDLPVGAVPGATWTAVDDRIAPGETLVMVSDGLLDLHPDVDVMAAAIGRLVCSEVGAAEAAHAIAHSGAGRSTDDITVVLARRAA